MHSSMYTHLLFLHCCPHSSCPCLRPSAACAWGPEGKRPSGAANIRRVACQPESIGHCVDGMLVNPGHMQVDDTRNYDKLLLYILGVGPLRAPLDVLLQDAAAPSRLEGLEVDDITGWQHERKQQALARCNGSRFVYDQEPGGCPKDPPAKQRKGADKH